MAPRRFIDGLARALKKDGTASKWPGRKPRVLEKTEQAHIQQLLTGLGGKVYVLGTRRSRGKRCRKCGEFVPEDQGTRQTPGVADLIAFLPPRRIVTIDPTALEVRPILLFIECKASDGRMSDDQQKFQELCQDALVEHVVGTLDAVIAWLVAHHYAKADQFPHYRQPQAAAAER